MSECLLVIFIGRALVSTHEYHRAVDFYESALRELKHTGPSQGQGQAGRVEGKEQEREGNGGLGDRSEECVGLAHDLAKLYMKLGMYVCMIYNIYQCPSCRDEIDRMVVIICFRPFGKCRSCLEQRSL